MKILPKELMFIQDYGTYTNQVLVLVGIKDKQKVFKFLKKERAKVDFSKWVLTDFDSWKKELEHKKKGLFGWNDEVQGCVLFLGSPEDVWEYWEILAHEIHHVVQKMAKDRMMFDEPDAQAYLFEFLFRSIRRKIQGIDKL